MKVRLCFVPIADIVLNLLLRNVITGLISFATKPYQSLN
jgi:hypothetical protein